ncbi:MAG: excinuclease ABC subunit UvrA [Candidatus Micrarchaeota archaeon]
MEKFIRIKGAREHNLKNIDLEIPRGKLVVFTGLSGSGKSTLAFDTIYAEGQRRYVESLSTYARQFLGLMGKPDVDLIEGLSPAISIDQKSSSHNPRSTVGTTTEIYDYMRLLYARAGQAHCPQCNVPISSQSVDLIADRILENEGQVSIYAPIVRGQKGTFEKMIEDLGRAGFTRVRIDSKSEIIDKYSGNIDKNKRHDVDLFIDRMKISRDERDRICEGVQSASERSEGLVKIEYEKGEETVYSTKNACPQCGFNYKDIEPRLFSFNSPYGACEGCHGLGIKMEIDPDLVIPDKGKSLIEGAVAPWNNRFQAYRMQALGAVASFYGFSMSVPASKMKKEHLKIILYGSDDEIDFKYVSRAGDSEWSSSKKWEGVIPILERIFHETNSPARRDEISRYMIESECQACMGKRLKKEALSVLVDGKSIIELSDLNIRALYGFFVNLKLGKNDEKIARPILKEIKNRLEFLINVGLDYLTLSRASRTLSGGEAQRIRLATQIGANLTGVLYVLDEPSIGLHQRDNSKLLSTLKNLRDLGNTLIVVEHDEDTMRAADFIVDIGPGAGARGGEVVASGKIEDIMGCKKSITGAYLRGDEKILAPKERREGRGWLSIGGCTHNNLKNVKARFPIGTFCCITGVSGSGKSSLISETLHPALSLAYTKAKRIKVGSHTDIFGLELADSVVNIDQSPIGRTPRSNPATYIGVFTAIRDLFARLPQSRSRGWRPGRFSFNVAGGRCMACEGDGMKKIEMNFLPDVYVECEECKGRRYNRDTLDVRYKGKNIADVLDMTVEEGLRFFANHPAIAHRLQLLSDVGLDYLQLGQSATTLSGGEAQRVKIAAELARRGEGKTIYILDEPTTGLHFADVAKLLEVLNRLVGKGNTVIVIEHNLDVVKSADYIIDLGPEGGENGGEIVACGIPEEIANCKESYTGQYLRGVLKQK